MQPDPRLEPESDREPSPPSPPSYFAERTVALLEVLLCSGYPTQIAISGTLKAFGYDALNEHGALTIAYVVGLSLADTVCVVGLALLFLIVHGERPRTVIAGTSPVGREIAAGIPLIPVALGIAVAVLLVTQRFAPVLHTVETNPLQALLRSPRDAWLFALVVVVAGGIREEVQRAFILHRFTEWLGGSQVGLVATSVAFGAGHLLQGADAAVATGLLGAFWGFVYLRRRSAIAPMVSHAGFDLVQIAQFLVAKRV